MTRTDAIFEAAEALASGEARCVDCGINPTVINDEVRIHDSETYATDDGAWVIRCGRCAGARSSR